MLEGKKLSIVVVGLMAIIVGVAANNITKANASKYDSVAVNTQKYVAPIKEETATNPEVTPEVTPSVEQKNCKHTNRKEIVTKEAECTKIGVKEIRCADCDKFIRKGLIPKLKHNFNENEQCERCGEFLKAKLWAKYDIDGATYKVTNPLSNGWGNVSYVAPTDKNVTKVDIPKEIKINERKYQVTKIEDKAFEGCTKLTKVTIGKKVKTIGKYAFENCTKLSNVSIGKGVKEIEKGAFRNCSGLKSIKIAKKVEVIGDEAFSNCINLKNVKIGKGTKKISKAAFYNCTNLKKVEIGTGLKTIETNAFYNCFKLKDIEIESVSLNKIEKNAFAGISPEAVIKLDKEHVETLKTIFTAETGIKDTMKIEGKKSLFDFFKKDDEGNIEVKDTQDDVQ